jgi:hypothetical protein
MEFCLESRERNFSLNSFSGFSVTPTSTTTLVEKNKMKKLLILAASLLSVGLVLPAAAQHRGHYQSQQTEIYISGYLPCGSPIYSRRPVSYGSCNSSHAYYEQQARIQREREIRRRLEIQREIERQRYLASLRNRGRSYHYQPRCR